MKRAVFGVALVLAVLAAAGWPQAPAAAGGRQGGGRGAGGGTPAVQHASGTLTPMALDVRDSTYKAGRYWGNAGQQFATGNRLSPDSRFHQNGRSNDGWVPPARGNMVQPPAQ
jgi:hypothetical protein